MEKVKHQRFSHATNQHLLWQREKKLGLCDCHYEHDFACIEAPNIIHTNKLAENISDIHEKDRYYTILANPPFGGKERAEVQQNFPIKTG